MALASATPAGLDGSGCAKSVGRQTVGFLQCIAIYMNVRPTGCDLVGRFYLAS